MRTRTAYPAAIGAAVLVGSLVAAAPAQAGGTNFTESTGACSMGSVWVLKAKPQLAGIELEFSVDTARAGQTWAVRVTDNKNLVFTGNRVTNKISRSLSLNRMTADRAGIDNFVARATNAKTGEVCRGTLAFAPGGGGGGKG
ncbi:MAG TPA: hypothetical protein VFI99_00395 [Nocardioides sp.]|jgi:hypothetical protein|nr:hypothetical protein [Nocardioides sp.]